MAVLISRIIDGGTTIQSVPPKQRDFKNTTFLWNGTKKGSNRTNYVGADLEAITTIYGSNSEVMKAAQTFLSGGFNGNSPRELYVSNIDTTTQTTSAVGELTLDADGKTLTYSGTMGDTPSPFWAQLKAAKATNNTVYADLTSTAITDSPVGVYLSIMDEAAGKIQAFLTNGDFITNTPIDWTLAPYSLTANDATLSSVAYTDNFADALSEVLGDSTVYHIIMDNKFTVEQKKIAMAQTEASQTTHYLYILDNSHEAKYQNAEDDTTSLADYAAAMKYTKTAIVVEDDAPSDETLADKSDEYKHASLCSYYAQVNWTVASPMGSGAFKTMAGITPSEFKDGGITLPTAAWDNVQAKNANCYTDFTEVQAPAWYAGKAANGNQIGDMIAKDYVLYQCDYNLFFMLQSLPKLPVNQAGATRIEQTMALGMQKLSDAGVIGGGTATDGEVFPTAGYKVSAEVPTGNDKIQGIWNNVLAKGLLTGTTLKIVYQIQLKF